jgi:SMODS and SLOG-associating 2TM effector domain 2
MPLLATMDAGGDLALQSWGYVAIALAAALIAADSAFGFSTSWIRYRTTQNEMERLLTGFRFDWAIELGKLNGSAPRPEQVENLLRVQRNFAEAIEAACEAETNTWVQEFRSSLAELAKAYRSASAARVPGAIDVRVANAAKADGDIEVLIDRRPAGVLIGTNFQIAEVPPGHHGVQVRGKIGGRESAASGMVEVKPGEVVRIDLALVERTGNGAAAPNGYDAAADNEQPDRPQPEPPAGETHPTREDAASR